MVVLDTAIVNASLPHHVDPYGEASRQTVERIRQGTIALGADPVTATQRAYAHGKFLLRCIVRCVRS